MSLFESILALELKTKTETELSIKVLRQNLGGRIWTNSHNAVKK